MSETRLSAEIQAMATIEEALTGLDEGARGRVLRWASERYGTAGVPPPASFRPNLGPIGEGDAGASGNETLNGGADRFETFADLFSQASPGTDADRVLVAAYWFDEVKGVSDLEARPINSELRNLGHAVGHMPSAFETLMARKPQPVIQTRKTGKSKQATKRYKLTTEGKRAVERMLEKPAGSR